jgi:hypothetical protein
MIVPGDEIAVYGACCNRAERAPASQIRGLPSRGYLRDDSTARHDDFD